MKNIQQLREDYHLLELENKSLSNELELAKKEKQDIQNKLDEILDMPRENLEEHLESLRSLRELRKKREENALETQRELFLQSKKSLREQKEQNALETQRELFLQTKKK